MPELIAPPPVESAPPTPRVPVNLPPEPRLRLAQLVHSLAHRRDARLLGEFLKLRCDVR